MKNGNIKCYSALNSGQLSITSFFCSTLRCYHNAQGIHKGKMKVALNEKRKKLHGFSFSKNIANFEAFLLVFKLTKNLLFLKSAVAIHSNSQLLSHQVSILPASDITQIYID